MDISDIFQNFRIGDAQRNSVQAKHTAEAQKFTMNQLQDQIDHLSLVCSSMCELLEEIGFDKSMLAKKIEEIDLRDGKRDGKTTRSTDCGSCGRRLAKRHITCIYCGAEIEGGAHI